jgi:hypothetical protein
MRGSNFAVSAASIPGAFRCGHSTEESNRKLVKGGKRFQCLICFRECNKLYVRAKRAAQRKDSTTNERAGELPMTAVGAIDATPAPEKETTN